MTDSTAPRLNDSAGCDETSDLSHRAAIRVERRPGLFGRRYVLPRETIAALEHVFGETVGGIIVVEHSCYARAHGGLRATTRPNRILLAISGAEFVENPVLLLHEYFHVVCQWQTGYLTRWRYIIETARCGYWANRYEREAREFTAATVETYRGYLRDAT